MKNKMIGITITIFFIFILSMFACEYDKNAGIDVYRVGDKVRLYQAPAPCVATILEYIPISKYKVKVTCYPYTESKTYTFIINEGGIEGRI
jgi:hypothetical protein